LAVGIAPNPEEAYRLSAHSVEDTRCSVSLRSLSWYLACYLGVAFWRTIVAFPNRLATRLGHVHGGKRLWSVSIPPRCGAGIRPQRFIANAVRPLPISIITISGKPWWGRLTPTIIMRGSRRPPGQRPRLS